MTRSTEGRMPPANLDAEASVLSTSLLSFEAFDRARAVLGGPDPFYSDANRLLFEACCAIADGGKEPDAPGVSGWLRHHNKLDRVGGTPYIMQVINGTPAILRVEDHARIVLELYRVRRLLSDLQLLTAEAYCELGDPRAWVEQVEQAVFRATEQQHETPPAEWIGEVAQQVYADSGATGRGEMPTGRSTGIHELDELTGGMCDGSVWYLAGRPGMGKSALAESIAGRIAQAGELVCAFSLEMPRKQVARRAAARDALVGYTALKGGQLEAHQWSSYATFLDRSRRWPIKIDDTPEISPARIRARIRRYFAEARRVFGGEVRLGAVIVDYLQLMSSDQAIGEGRTAQLETITRELKRIAREFECVMLVPCQLNRATEAKGDKRPTLSELRGSGSIEQDADFVIGLYREDYYRPQGEKRDDVVELIVLKARESDNGTVFAKWDGPTTRFYSASDTSHPQGSLPYGGEAAE